MNLIGLNDSTCNDTDSRVAIAVTDITEKLWKRTPHLGRFL